MGENWNSQGKKHLTFCKQSVAVSTEYWMKIKSKAIYKSVLLMFLTTEKADDKIFICKFFLKKLSPKYIIMRFQRLESKQLTLKALITTAADDIHKYFFIVFQRK